MPRKRKDAPQKRRESSGNRWKRNRAAVDRDKALGVNPDDPNHMRIVVDPHEYASLFTLEGGRESIGPGIVRAFDRHGRRPGKAVAPSMTGVGRNTVAKWSTCWETAAAVTRARESLREERKQNQVQALRDAYENHSFGWRRQEVPDQNMRSVLCGSNNGRDPTEQSRSLVVCYKEDDGRYHVAQETWNGMWSSKDADGRRERVGVDLDPLPITFFDEKEAQTAIVYAAKMGELPRFENRVDATWTARFASRTRAWEHEGDDMKARYPRRVARVAEPKQDEIDLTLEGVRSDLGLRAKHEPAAEKGRRVRVEPPLG